MSKGWEAYLFETTTGSVGPALSIKEASYSISLSGDTTAKLELDKTDLPNHNLAFWLDSWGPSVLFKYDGRPIYAGPLVSNPKEYYGSIQFDSIDVRGILAKRIMVSETALDSSAIAKGVVKYTGLSLGTIAQEVVQFCMDKPGGNLPIQFMSPRQNAANDADHQRTYKAFNANTISGDEVLTKISEVSRGPDIAFRPIMLDDSQVVWGMYHGTEGEPRIRQKLVPEWDLTAVKNQSASLEVTKTGSYLTDRVISVGGGTNEKTVMATTEDLSKTRKRYPLLESVVTVSDSENKTVVMNHAKSSLKQNRKPLREYTLVVNADGKYPLGTFWPGEKIAVYTKGYFNIPDGRNEMRLLNMSGNFGSNEVRLSLQLDSQWD